MCLKKEVNKWGNSSLALAYCFFKTGTTLAFFHLKGNFPFSKNDREIIPSGFQTDSYIFNIRILIIS